MCVLVCSWIRSFMWLGELEDLIQRFFSGFCEQSKIWVWVFFLFVFLRAIWVWVFFCEPNLLGFFWCFVTKIFRFAKFISGFAKFLGFVGFFVHISLLEASVWMARKLPRKCCHCQENYMYILWFVILGLFWFLGVWFWAGARRVGFRCNKKNPFIKRVEFG